MADLLAFSNTFSQVFETLEFFFKKKERNIIYTRFDCFHAHSLHENLHVSSCCLELLCSQYLVVVQVVIWSEPGDVVDLLLPPVGLG